MTPDIFDIENGKVVINHNCLAIPEFKAINDYYEDPIPAFNFLHFLHAPKGPYCNVPEEDKEEILMKFEGEEEMGTEDMGSEDITSDTEVEDIQADMDTEIPTEGEMFEDMEDYDFAKSQHMEEYDEDFESLFGESKVDNVITKYFEMTKKDKL